VRRTCILLSECTNTGLMCCCTIECNETTNERYKGNTANKILYILDFVYVVLRHKLRARVRILCARMGQIFFGHLAAWKVKRKGELVNNSPSVW